MPNTLNLHPRLFLAQLFASAVGATLPRLCLPPFLPAPPKGKIVVVGAGKAAAAMAQAVEQHWPDLPLQGLVVTRYGHAVACRKIEIVEAGHPLPDAAGETAAQRILQMVQGLSADDLVLCLISGGGSALLSLPAPGISLAQKKEINHALLRCGARISEINTVRKHLSAIKGGRLALAALPAQVLSLVISDVPGDDPSMVASGPTLPDASTCAQALAICKKYGISLPRNVVEYLHSEEAETPKPGDPRFANQRCEVVASAQHALLAAARLATQNGITPYILSDCMEGEARDVARVHAALVRQILRSGDNSYCAFQTPCLLLSGGETTVTLHDEQNQGRGGRNSEFLLALLLALEDMPGLERVYGLACDTDGIDGSEQNAGACFEPQSLQRAQALGINAHAHLANNDAYGFFSVLEDLIVTGPSLTNVNDFRAILVL